LQAFLRAAAGHRLFPMLWLAAMTGMRRNEVLGLQWPDVDFAKGRLSLNRGLVAIGYELHQTRGKTESARRSIDLDTTTLAVLAGWKALQAAEFAAVGIDDDGWVFTDGDGQPIHPHALSQTFERIARRGGVPVIRLHDLRHTHGTLLIKEGVP
jgi:integrase